MPKNDFLNFQVDHMTLLVEPEMYKASYLVFRVIFGAAKADILYEKRKEWIKGQGEVSMTFAARIGRPQNSAGGTKHAQSAALDNTIIAVVQPSEPESQGSHVRRMLQEHSASAHWQHIALRTPDLLAFHKHAAARGVNFITPILKDADEDLIQVFSGEWFPPGGKASAVFFEFVQRNPTPALLKKLETHNRESWFRDKTFLGLYSEKEKEYQSGRIAPFVDPPLFERLQELVRDKKLWDIAEEDVRGAERVMLDYARNKERVQV